jgi:hypothetical protein
VRLQLCELVRDREVSEVNSDLSERDLFGSPLSAAAFAALSSTLAFFPLLM